MPSDSKILFNLWVGYGSLWVVFELSKTLSYGSRLKLSKTLSYGSRFRS
ncbi:hypothetical protein LEP1GSC020_0041 [Leptospira interrogans serovar Grippotyphosa str. 2006006986]|nr:hypothetical protein LEP1GSC020_0041 [Leptospira interrogans serovar Grippotyphosa str. 2006006986]